MPCQAAPVPTLRPERPKFANGAERTVWQHLRDQLSAEAALLSGLRVTTHAKDHEADVVVAVPGYGIVAVEVKGGSVWHERGRWLQRRGDGVHRIDPVEQARGTRYALRELVERDRRWGSRGRLTWAHAVALPNTEVADDFAAPDCPRWMVLDRTQLPTIATDVVDILARSEERGRPPTTDDIEVLLEILLGRGLPQRDTLAAAAEREDEAHRLTQEQAVLLGATQLLRRVEIRGGAGSGKTWLALEQARRLGRNGERVALLCYSRGLAAYLQRATAEWKRQHRPSYVGGFHGLGTLWGAATGGRDDDPDYWETELPAQMLDAATRLPDGQKFDAVVVDEAQDFADAWWPVLLAALRDPEHGGVYAFSDSGQRVFARYGEPPVPLVPLVLDHNLRNTRQIASTFNSLTPLRMRLFGGEGPAVKFVPCAADEALERADDEVDALFDDGWRAEDIALLATGSRHIEQVSRQEQGQGSYWDTFWDADQVFYGHVLGFKGLERRAVVLAVNEPQVGDRSRERLYVGLSRARDQLVVCGDPDVIEKTAGADVVRLLQGARG